MDFIIHSTILLINNNGRMKEGFMLNFFDENGNFLINDFINSERIIMLQWENQETIKNMSGKDLIDRYSLYMCHINDEIKEAYDADTLEDFFKEVIDISMYIASVANLFKIKAESIFGNDLNSLINEQAIIDSYKDKKTWKMSYNDLSGDITIKLSSIRESFPQRKWHKNAVNFETGEFLFVLTKSYVTCINMIYSIINFLMNRCLNDTFYINRIINIKQNKIVNVAKNTGTNIDVVTIKELVQLSNEIEEGLIL